MYAYAVGHAIDEQWALGAKNAPRGTRFMSAYSCRLDVGHEIHHYTEQITGIHISVKRNYARFSRESPSARYGI